MGSDGTAVLVIDTDREWTRSLFGSMHSDRFDVDHESDYDAALATLGRGVHDVALIAEGLGARGGLDLIRAAQRAGCTLPLVFVADRGGKPVSQAALEAGAVDYVDRGRADADVLARAIRAAIRQHRTEKALRDSEAWYHQLFESVPQPMLAYDIETLEILDANQAAVEQYGYTREEFLRLTVTDMRPPEDVPRFVDWIRNYKDRPYTTEGIWRHRKKDGTTIDVEIRSNALPWQGRPARVVAVRDLTPQRRAEATQRESAQFVRDVLDSLQAYVAVVQSDGLILAVNRRWREAAAAADVLLIARAVEGTNYLDVCEAAGRTGAAAGAELAAGLRAVLAGQDDRFTREYTSESAGARRWLAVRVLPFFGDGPRRAVVAHLEITERKNAEEALRESEQRFQAVLDSSKAIIYLKELSGRYLFVNREWTERFNTTMAEVVGKTDYELFPKATADLFRANDRLALEAGRAVEVEETAPHDDGPRAYVSIKAPLYDVRGVAYATCGISTNITARRRDEEALRESEARFRGAFDSAAIGMAIVALDGRFIEVNQSLCDFSGRSEGELLATDFQSITHADDIANDLSAFHSLLRGEIRHYQMEKRYIHKDGHELWGLLSVSVVTDVRGAPLYVISEVKDITAHKRAEAALARLLDRLKRLRQLDQAILSAASPREVAQTALDHLLQLVPCCSGRVDIVELRNGRRTVLASRGESPPGRARDSDVHCEGDAPNSCAAELPPTDLACDLAREASDLGRVYVRKPLTYKGRLLGGLHLYFDRSGVPDPEHLEFAREVADLLAIALWQARLFRQVRRGRRRLSALSQRLIAAQEAERRRLARELHDEIGQSLTALKLGIQAGADSDDARTRSALAEEGRQVIDQLIDQVRNLSLNLRPSMLDDFGLVSALRWYVDRMARRSGIEARLAVTPTEIRTAAEIETACFRIAQEALTNVTRYASAKHVWVELHRVGNELSMTIRDDGVGFDVVRAREQAARGTGLGLLGMRERAALLGGRIEIASAPGEGTRVHVTLPLGPAEL